MSNAHTTTDSILAARGAGHTRGPWTLCDAGDYGDFEGRSRVILSGEPRRLAAVHVSDEETDANARLIAAAPELLECLQQLLDGMVGVEDSEDRVLERSRSAILKATGANHG